MHLIRCGSGDPILFIHGMPTSSHLWSQMIAQLCANFSCFAVDLPGMGETPQIAYEADFLRKIAEEIDQIRAANGIEKWHVVGHDAGSVVAVHYAKNFPQHVACMALLAPALFPELRPFYLLEVLRKPVMGELLAPFIRFAFWKIAMRRAVVRADRNAETIREFYRPFAGLMGPWRFMKLLRWGNPATVLAEIPRFMPTLPMQTLVFHGEGDAAIPAEFASRAARLLPNATMVTVDAGHFIPLDQPEPVAARLTDFFTAYARENLPFESLASV
jgi:pimeloyl-ACP methyl ester carboxylesterase